MLLRRMTQHLKDQNWTAVALDFAIVVSGVFLGIQFANWNAARLDAQAEQGILERLQTELDQAAAVQTLYQNFADQRLANLSTARLVLLGLAERNILTSEECLAIAESHLPVTPLTNILIINELTASGELALVRDDRVVSAISAFSTQNDLERMILSESQIYRTLLSARFPDLITYQIERDDGEHAGFDYDGFDPVYGCNTAAMMENQAFLNAFGENVTRVFFLVEQSTVPKSAALNDLKEAVEAAVSSPR